jgi:hypothetical protein
MDGSILRYHVCVVFFSVYALFACGQKEHGNEAGPSMIVKNYEGHVFVDFFGDERNLQIGFYPCGVNRLFGIAEVSYFPGWAAHHRGEASNRFLSCTDWIGPYYVCSLVSRQAGLPLRFTGGWHGSNGDGTGEPTAATSGVTIRVNNEELTGNFERACDQAALVVTNLIQGYDYALSKRELLRETVQYDITVDRKIAVCVCIEALDDVVIQRYYGLQSQNFSIFDSVSYASDDQVCHTAPVKANSNSPQAEAVNAIILTGASNQHRLRLVLNIREGLGTAEYLAPELPRAFSASYGKSYFNLVNGRELILKKGEKVFWKGAYYWD